MTTKDGPEPDDVGQGLGIFGGAHVAPFPRFVVNTDAMYLGYCKRAGDGTADSGGDGTGDLFVRGKVAIGTESPNANAKLDVNGPIYQRGSLLHADYVFEPDYALESIEEHSNFMWSEKHLPGIAKAEKDVEGREIVEIGAQRRGILEELEKAHVYIEQLHRRIGEM